MLQAPLEDWHPFQYKYNIELMYICQSDKDNLLPQENKKAIINRFAVQELRNRNIKKPMRVDFQSLSIIKLDISRGRDQTKRIPHIKS